MKLSVAQQRIFQRMLGGARLRWNCISARHELDDGTGLLGVQTRTIVALEAAGLVERESLGDVLLAPAARAVAAAASSAGDRIADAELTTLTRELDTAQEAS